MCLTEDFLISTVACNPLDAEDLILLVFTQSSITTLFSIVCKYAEKSRNNEFQLFSVPTSGPLLPVEMRSEIIVSGIYEKTFSPQTFFTKNRPKV